MLPSGLVLVTGPFKVNGVPVRRVNPRYVIATSVAVDLAGVDASKFGDDYFARPKKPKTPKSLELKAPEEAPRVVPDERKADQEQLDASLLKNLTKTPLLKSYLRARFSRKKGQHPHEMVF